MEELTYPEDSSGLDELIGGKAAMNERNSRLLWRCLRAPALILPQLRAPDRRKNRVASCDHLTGANGQSDRFRKPKGAAWFLSPRRHRDREAANSHGRQYPATRRPSNGCTQEGQRCLRNWMPPARLRLNGLWLSECPESAQSRGLQRDSRDKGWTAVDPKRWI